MTAVGATPPIRGCGALRLTVVCLALVLPLPVTACSVPVFRYALQHWPLDAYTVEIQSNGPLTEAEAAAVPRLQEAIDAGALLHLSLPAPPSGAANADNAQPAQLRLIGPSATIVWQAPLTATAVSAVLSSPTRADLARRLSVGDGVVWLFLECGRPATDNAAFARLTAALAECETSVTLPVPQGPEMDLEGLLSTSEQPRFPVIRMTASATADEVLTAVLRQSEPELADLQAPLAFPVYGRGRVLYALAGAGITPENVLLACEYLCAACSCFVKAQNHGLDLPMGIHAVAPPDAPASTTAGPELPSMAGLMDYRPAPAAAQSRTAAGTETEPRADPTRAAGPWRRAGLLALGLAAFMTGIAWLARGRPSTAAVAPAAANQPATSGHSARNPAAHTVSGSGLLLALVAIALIALPPLAGAYLRGAPLARYADMPPTTRYTEHAPFSWPVWIFMAGAILLSCVWLYRPHPSPRPQPGDRTGGNVRPPFPAWGRTGLLLTALSWIAAWLRPNWLGTLAGHTFAPLWLGFILVLDGLVYRRKGTSMIARSTPGFLLLLPVSALAWWLFEYLNRFVQNWYYSDTVNAYSALNYVLLATPPFATVLPAVFEAAELVGTAPWCRTGYTDRKEVPRPSRQALLVVLAGGIAGGILTGALPSLFFPALWLAPLFVIIPLLALAGRGTPLDWLAHGSWRPIVQLSLGALVCGFFWELWNAGSMPRWHYAIPYVGRFHLFEMPLLGYAGYLPFGVECYCAYLLLEAAFPIPALHRLRPGDLTPPTAAT